VGQENMYFGMPLDKLIEERKEISRPEAYSESWEEVFEKINNDPITIEMLREDFQLYFLQKPNDDNSTCLHLICK
jgi:hypothetical protein